jgi:S-methylmethionine-dependent homocysteine/selenocysteine methylase
MQDLKTQALVARTAGRVWLADGGLETAMIFLEGLELPQFASFPLVETETGKAALTRYFDGFMDEAAAHRTGFLMDTATWRASHGWGDVMGLTADQIDEANRKAVRFALAAKARRPDIDVIVNGVVGPHGDAYAPDRVLTAAEAQEYHGRQVEVLAKAGAEMISAMTISSTGEAIGVARAATKVGMPVVLSFTVETDGQLISGMSLAEAIAETDAATGGVVAWYGINCAHPDHFRHRLTGDWVNRVGMVRANASAKSHAELDEATELDAGDPDAIGRDYGALRQLLPGLRVVGGCCGTDLRHITAMGKHVCGHAHAA